MRKLWDFWKNKKYGKKSMTGWFLLTNALLCGGIGAALWGVVSLVALKGISWLIIFAGYAINRQRSGNIRNGISAFFDTKYKYKFTIFTDCIERKYGKDWLL